MTVDLLARHEKAGRKRALKLYPNIGPCDRCNNPRAERHHRDGNTHNNTPDNIQALCRRCHMEADGRLAEFAARGAAQLSEVIEKAAVVRRSRTVCKHGHPLSGDNLYVTPKGWRACKTCGEINRRAYLARKAGAA